MSKSRCRHLWVEVPEVVEECAKCGNQRHTRRDPMFTIREYYRPDEKGVLRCYKTTIRRAFQAGYPVEKK